MTLPLESWKEHLKLTKLYSSPSETNDAILSCWYQNIKYMTRDHALAALGTVRETRHSMNEHETRRKIANSMIYNPDQPLTAEDFAKIVYPLRSGVDVNAAVITFANKNTADFSAYDAQTLMRAARFVRDTNEIVVTRRNIALAFVHNSTKPMSTQEIINVSSEIDSYLGANEVIEEYAKRFPDSLKFEDADLLLKNVRNGLYLDESNTRARIARLAVDHDQNLLTAQEALKISNYLNDYSLKNSVLSTFVDRNASRLNVSDVAALMDSIHVRYHYSVKDEETLNFIAYKFANSGARPIFASDVQLLANKSRSPQIAEIVSRRLKSEGDTVSPQRVSELLRLMYTKDSSVKKEMLDRLLKEECQALVCPIPPQKMATDGGMQAPRRIEAPVAELMGPPADLLNGE